VEEAPHQGANNEEARTVDCLERIRPFRHEFILSIGSRKAADCGLMDHQG